MNNDPENAQGLATCPHCGLVQPEPVPVSGGACFRDRTLLIAMSVFTLGCLVWIWRAGMTSEGLAKVLVKEVPELDSFSSSGVALAILTQKTERCTQAAEESGSDLSLHEMEQISAAIGKLRLTLDKELIQIYLRRRVSTKVVDSYLDLLHEAPNSDVIIWAVHALECAKECGRTEELLEAMEQFCRFHPNCTGLQDVLDHSAAGVLSRRISSVDAPGH